MKFMTLFMQCHALLGVCVVLASAARPEEGHDRPSILRPAQISEHPMCSVCNGTGNIRRGCFSLLSMLNLGKKLKRCKSCNGTGKKYGRTIDFEQPSNSFDARPSILRPAQIPEHPICSECNGTGNVRRRWFSFFRKKKKCKSCNGTGKNYDRAIDFVATSVEADEHEVSTSRPADGEESTSSRYEENEFARRVDGPSDAQVPTPSPAQAPAPALSCREGNTPKDLVHIWRGLEVLRELKAEGRGTGSDTASNSAPPAAEREAASSADSDSPPPAAERVAAASADSDSSCPSSPSGSAPSSDESEADSSPWEEVIDPDSGRTYYYNDETRETTWVRSQCSKCQGVGRISLAPDATQAVSEDAVHGDFPDAVTRLMCDFVPVTCPLCKGSGWVYGSVQDPLPEMTVTTQAAAERLGSIIQDAGENSEPPKVEGDPGSARDTSERLGALGRNETVKRSTLRGKSGKRPTLAGIFGPDKLRLGRGIAQTHR